MSSWGRSACYPRRTFYPLSDGPSIRNHRITMPYFRTCSTCMSHSQAPLCHCTLHTIANRIEGTFGSLRYSFGGDHPSQTTHHALSPQRGLGPGQTKAGISTAAPRRLAAPLQCLPAILHIGCPASIRSYSKGD